jgi:hypothetical protein
MSPFTPGHGEPGHEHTDACMARVSVGWVDEMYDLAEAVGCEDLSPHELLAFAAHAIAKSIGFVPSAEDYQHLLDEHADTLEELVQARYDREFDGIVTNQP